MIYQTYIARLILICILHKIYIQVDSNIALACKANWTCGAADSSFGFAAKRTLESGADIHVKTDLTGTLDIAHVSVSAIFECRQSFKLPVT